MQDSIKKRKVFYLTAQTITMNMMCSGLENDFILVKLPKKFFIHFRKIGYYDYICKAVF